MADYTSIYDGAHVDKGVGLGISSYVPTLLSPPTSSTLTFTLDGDSVNFREGMFCRVPDNASVSGYRFYRLHNLATSGNTTIATWEPIGDGDNNRVVVVVSNYDDNNTNLALVTASISINGGTATAMTGVLETTAHTKTFTANVNIGETYVITFNDVSGYVAPMAISDTKQGYANGYNVTYSNIWVDLGLPSGTLWASGNICKDSQGNYYMGKPTENGCYFSWGNIVGHNRGTTPHVDGDGNTYFDVADGYEFSEPSYYSLAQIQAVTEADGGEWDHSRDSEFPGNGTPGGDLLASIAGNDSTHDAALALLGNSARLPTVAELDELITHTRYEYIFNYGNSGVNGFEFRNELTGASIFFPASGAAMFFDYGEGNVQQGVYDVLITGFYPTSTIYENSFNCYSFIFRYDFIDYIMARYIGSSIRAVK